MLAAREAPTISGAGLWPAGTLVGVTGFEPAASSSRSLVDAQIRACVEFLLDVLQGSGGVRVNPPKCGPGVTQLVTHVFRPAAEHATRRPEPMTRGLKGQSGSFASTLTCRLHHLGLLNWPSEACRHFAAIARVVCHTRATRPWGPCGSWPRRPPSPRPSACKPAEPAGG